MGRPYGEDQSYGPADGEMVSQPRMMSEPQPMQQQVQPDPEEVPTGRPTAAVYRNELGQAVSYGRPVDSSRTSRRLGDRQPQDFDR